MTPDWQNFLALRGAIFEAGVLRHFGNPQAELAAAKNGGILTELSRYGLLAFAGADATAFLHGQLTNDVKRLDERCSQYGGYCTAQGRMLASFLMWRMANGYCVQLPAELLESVRKRLTTFILRAKVTAEDVSDRYVRLGIAGRAAEAALQACALDVPPAPNGVTRVDDAVLLRLGEDRFELVVPQAEAPRWWDALAARLKPVGPACWEWLEIRAGIPSVRTATREQFVPQMANLELIGGVVFNKGCYPGQEIVARTQYLGKVKRRMYLARIEADTPPAEGDPLFGADFNGQASGMIVNAQAAPGGGYDVLAVVHTSSVEAGVNLKSPDGPPLRFQPLPYAN